VKGNELTEDVTLGPKYHLRMQFLYFIRLLVWKEESREPGGKGKRRLRFWFRLIPSAE